MLEEKYFTSFSSFSWSYRATAKNHEPGVQRLRLNQLPTCPCIFFSGAQVKGFPRDPFFTPMSAPKELVGLGGFLRNLLGPNSGILPGKERQ